MKAILMRVVFLFVSLLLFSACQVTLRHETVEPKAQDRGLVVMPIGDGVVGLKYALPSTALRFTVKAEKVVKKRGDFYLYSERYLGLKNVILEDEVTWNIKEICLSSYGVPSDNQFVVSPSAGVASNFSLSEDGLLLSINEEFIPVEEDIVHHITINNDEPVVPYTEEMLLANSTAKMAQEAARYIYQLRESRTALISSDLEVAPSDGLALNKSLEEIAKTEEQFVNMFAGSVIRTSENKIIDLVPEKVGDRTILFRFSTFNGIVDKDDLSGSPVYLELKEAYSPIEVELPDTAGLYYIQPARVDVALFDGRSQILNESMMMAQFGVLNALPQGYINDQVKMHFYPSTGAIKAIYKE